MKQRWIENLFDALVITLLAGFAFWVGYGRGYARHSEIADEADAKLGREIRESYERMNQRIVEEVK